ncbi:MAG TPA: hypothetical protein VNA25_21580 [Phycisphaerae bacterium]|nr:hypothetical protein [Phycisphaerae bacterium]
MISGLDLEVRWLANLGIPGVLVPPPRALDHTAKPATAVAATLGLRVPEFISLDEEETDLLRFCRWYDWDLWVKGPNYEAIRVRRWDDVLAARDMLRDTWGEKGLYLQAHVEGQEVAVAFAAYRGELLDAVFMEKRLLVEGGKTWAGHVRECPELLCEKIAGVLSNIGWMGGGEVECVKDCQGALWLIDWNPRFPAWIHGSTLAGHNLPAALVGRATGLEPQRPCQRIADQFIRVTLEVPVRDGLPLPPIPLVRHHKGGHSKHPSGMPLLMRRLSGPILDTMCPSKRKPSGTLADCIQEDLREALRDSHVTPRRAFLPRSASAAFEQAVCGVASAMDELGIQVSLCYSVKTNPDAKLLALARANGLLAEVIGPNEAEWATACGFALRDVVYNGPLTPPLRRDGQLYRAVFADSLPSLRLLIDRAQPAAEVFGARLRPPGLDSRFGIDVGEPRVFSELVGVLRRLPSDAQLGVSFHMQSSTWGIRRWVAIAEAVVAYATELCKASRARLALLNLGGGWNPEDFGAFLRDFLPPFVRAVRQQQPAIRTFLLEPGKALAQSSSALMTTVTEIRRGSASADVVVDAGVCDLPEAEHLPHVILAESHDSTLFQLQGGADRILGRLCMEKDILARSVTVPDFLREGDHLVFLGAGAYDTSMAYRFGLGGSGEATNQ